MSDDKHGEPWEVEYDSEYASVNLYDKDGKGIFLHASISSLSRAVLCVNACAGMSDEEVERFANGTMDCKDCINATTALEAKLADARELLGECTVKLDGMVHEFQVDKIHTFLTRHKGK